MSCHVLRLRVQKERTYVGRHDGVGRTSAGVVRRQSGRTADVVGGARQRAGGAVVVPVDLVVWTVHLAEHSAAALRLDAALPRRVLAYTAQNKSNQIKFIYQHKR